ncbi:MAG: hypothetical protein Q4P36_00475 [Bowdeniella nasicola]|nr:hypothetical protein [Bowdeniella nasicola]
MSSSLVKLATEHSHLTPIDLPMHPYMYGAIAFSVLMVLLLTAYAFRSVWTRH